MAKVILVNLYEPPYLGTRALAAWLLKCGHDVHNITLKTADGYTKTTVDEPLEDHKAFLEMYNGVLCLRPMDAVPITATELKLLEQTIAKHKPDLIGFSARSTYDFLLPTIVPVLRKSQPNALLVAGGYGPTLEPELYLDGGFDCVIKGDGEEALEELVNSLGNSSTLQGILNTCWKSETAGYLINPMRPQTKNLDKYPVPLYAPVFFTIIDRDMVMEKVSPIDRPTDYNPYTTIAGRGCVGRCTYCSGGQWAKIYRDAGSKAYKRRNRSIDSIIAELKEAKSNGHQFIIFYDEYFAFSSTEGKRFFKEYKEHVKLPFFLYLPYEHFLKDKELQELAFDAGLDHTSVGIQTGSEEFAKKYYHRDIKNDILYNFIRLMYDHDVGVVTQLIAGNCYETDIDFMETIKLIQRLPFCLEDESVTKQGVFKLNVLPKAPLREIAPRVVTHPASAREYWYKASLMNLARVVSAADIDAAMHDNTLATDPKLILAMYKQELQKKKKAHYQAVFERVKDKDAILYGDKDVIVQNYDFLSSTLSVRGVLVDDNDEMKNYFSDLCTEFDVERVSKKMVRPISMLEVNAGAVSRGVHFLCLAKSRSDRLKRSLKNRFGIERENITMCTTDLSELFK